MDQKSYKIDKVYTILRPLGENGILEAKIVRNDAQAKNHVEYKYVEIKAKTPHKKGITFHIWDFSKQLAFSAMIFGLLFFAMNWSAYKQIFQVKYGNITGQTVQANVLQEYTKPGAPPVKQKLLEVDKNPEKEKKNIPYMALKVAPPDTRLIIPRINKNIPIIQVSDDALLKRDFNSLEKEIQKGLESGVINYPGTSKPGETGNIVITGHSSYFPWKSGRFKDVFAILEEIEEGDKIVMFYNQKKYIYDVFKIEVVSPKNIDPLKQTKENILTLITCVPVGTDLNRLIIQAKLISIES